MNLRTWIGEEFQLTPALRDLRNYSPLSFAVERLFFALQIFSVANLLFGTRRSSHEAAGQNEEQMRQLTIRRGRRIDCYVVVWLAIVLLSAMLAPSAGRWPCLRALIAVVVGYRVVEIGQVAVNLALFDHLRITRTHSVSSITRTLILTLWNYFEVVICFAVVYRMFSSGVLRGPNEPITSMMEAFYFSAVTQLTIGYGDLHPSGGLMMVAPIQGVIGLMFGLLVVARFVTLLPKIAPVQQE